MQAMYFNSCHHPLVLNTFLHFLLCVALGIGERLLAAANCGFQHNHTLCECFLYLLSLLLSPRTELVVLHVENRVEFCMGNYVAANANRHLCLCKISNPQFIGQFCMTEVYSVLDPMTEGTELQSPH